MAEKKTLVVSPAEIDKILNNYKTQKVLSNDIVVELSGVNNMDVLLLLKIMSKKEQSVDDIAQAAEIMLDGQLITFKRGDEILKSVAYNRASGGALHMLFIEDVYLYDILQQTVYALMLKKLTPHLEGSN